MKRPPRILRLFAALALFVVLLLALVGPGSRDHEPALSPVDAPVASGAASRPVPKGTTLETGFLGQGGTLARVLDEKIADDPDRAALLAAAGRYLDLRRLSPRTGITVRRDAEGKAVSVALRGEPGRFLRIGLTGPKGSIRAELLALPVQTEVRRTAGRVTHSVAQAFSGSPQGAWLTNEFADIFQWDIDLLVDPRPGDLVRVIYEVQRLGPVPADLPPFGDAARQSGDLLGPGKILAASYEGRIAEASAFWVDNGKPAGSYYDSHGTPLRKSFLKSPLNYRRISSGFSRARRHPVTRRVVPHHGVDFAANPGTPVVATADGRVTLAGWDGALGRAVRVRHGSEYVTIYGHLRGLARGVRVGADVRQNQVIGYVGSTGRATGPHLHYSVLRRGQAVNPFRMENPPAEPLDEALMPWLARATLLWTPALEAIPPTHEAQIAAGEPATQSTTDVLTGM